MQDELKKVRDWASAKLTGEPPWACHQYLRLRDTIDAILEGMAATVTTETSTKSAERPGPHLRLVASADPRDPFNAI